MPRIRQPSRGVKNVKNRRGKTLSRLWPRRKNRQPNRQLIHSPYAEFNPTIKFVKYNISGVFSLCRVISIVSLTDSQIINTGRLLRVGK